MKLAERLATAREKAGLSQVDLAKILDVSPGTVAGWETGAHGIHLGRIEQVASALKLKSADLIADMIAEAVA